MKKNRRPLGAMERTQAIMGRHYPLNVVVILQVVNGPLPEQLKRAVDVLLHRHPLLSACIKQEKRSYFFQIENPKNKGTIFHECRSSIRLYIRKQKTSPKSYTSVRNRMAI